VLRFETPNVFESTDRALDDRSLSIGIVLGTLGTQFDIPIWIFRFHLRRGTFRDGHGEASRLLRRNRMLRSTPAAISAAQLMTTRISTR
jgi:hypothetical protein